MNELERDPLVLPQAEAAVPDSPGESLQQLIKTTLSFSKLPELREECAPQYTRTSIDEQQIETEGRWMESAENDATSATDNREGRAASGRRGAFRKILSLAAVSTAVLLSRSAVTQAEDTNPVPTSGDDAPAQASEQECADVATSRPALARKLVMYRAGERLQQITRGTFLFPALPEECTPEYLRIAKGQQQLERGDHWVNTGGNVGVLGNHEQRNPFAGGETHAWPDYIYSSCVNGHFQRARIVVDEYLKTGVNGHRSVVDHERYYFPIEVKGSCKAAERSRRYYETHDR